MELARSKTSSLFRSVLPVSQRLGTSSLFFSLLNSLRSISPTPWLSTQPCLVTAFFAAAQVTWVPRSSTG